MKNQHITVKNLPVSERPYEKLEKYGASNLSDAELLAIIIRCGSSKERSTEVATRLLDAHESVKGLPGLFYLSLPELKKVKGIGRVKAIQIQAVAELTRRMAKATRAEAPCFQTPDAIADYYMQDMRHLEQEQVVLLMLTSKSQYLKDKVISSGTVNSSLISPREIFVEALRYHAVFIILVHNHPSGDPSPSKEDYIITKKIQEAGILVGIKLMDHVIIGDNRYISLKEKGFL